jgi:hypothetical protein
MKVTKSYYAIEDIDVNNSEITNEIYRISGFSNTLRMTLNF